MTPDSDLTRTCFHFYIKLIPFSGQYAAVCLSQGTQIMTHSTGRLVKASLSVFILEVEMSLLVVRTACFVNTKAQKQHGDHDEKKY